MFKPKSEKSSSKTFFFNSVFSWCQDTLSIYCANLSSTTHFVNFVTQRLTFWAVLSKQALRRTKESSRPQKKMGTGLKIMQKSFYGVYMTCANGELKVGRNIMLFVDKQSGEKLWNRQQARFVTLFFDFWLENLEILRAVRS